MAGDGVKTSKKKPVVKKQTKVVRDSQHVQQPSAKTKRPTAQQKPYTLGRDEWNDIKSRNRGRSGSDAKIWMMEELEPYMGDYMSLRGTDGSGLFPGLVNKPSAMPDWVGGYGGGGGGDGGGGGGGGGPYPTPPAPFKIRTTMGNRLTPYWESEPDFVQGWTPRLTVLGNTQAW